jgi:hypothetical protein
MRRWIPYGLLLFFTAATGLGFSAVLAMAGVIMHDFNFATFRDKLTADEQQGITITVVDMLSGGLVAFIVTNLLWAGYAAYLLKRGRDATRRW